MATLTLTHTLTHTLTLATLTRATLTHTLVTHTHTLPPSPPTSSTGDSVDPVMNASNDKLDAWAQTHGAARVIVCTGFVARNERGQISTLKRNGSDYSATIMGALVEASAISIWTDVDGVYSADPRKVKDAVCLKYMSYNEAWELAYFGANVLHPRTTLPALKYRIPVILRNAFNVANPGTTITTTEEAKGERKKKYIYKCIIKIK